MNCRTRALATVLGVGLVVAPVWAQEAAPQDAEEATAAEERPVTEDTKGDSGGPGHKSGYEEKPIFGGPNTWEVLDRGTEDTGSIVVVVDHRHAYTDVSRANLGGEAGYLGQSGTLLSDVNLVLVELNWKQSFKDRRAGLTSLQFLVDPAINPDDDEVWILGLRARITY